MSHIVPFTILWCGLPVLKGSLELDLLRSSYSTWQGQMCMYTKGYDCFGQEKSNKTLLNV